MNDDELIRLEFPDRRTGFSVITCRDANLSISRGGFILSLHNVMQLKVNVSHLILLYFFLKIDKGIIIALFC